MIRLYLIILYVFFGCKIDASQQRLTPIDHDHSNPESDQDKGKLSDESEGRVPGYLTSLENYKVVFDGQTWDIEAPTNSVAGDWHHLLVNFYQIQYPSKKDDLNLSFLGTSEILADASFRFSLGQRAGDQVLILLQRKNDEIINTLSINPSLKQRAARHTVGTQIVEYVYESEDLNYNFVNTTENSCQTANQEACSHEVEEPKTVCSEGTVLSHDGITCIPICAFGEYPDETQTKCIPIVCSENQQLNEAGNGCEPIAPGPPSCNFGEELNADRTRCVAITCASDMRLNAAGNGCEKKPITVPPPPKPTAPQPLNCPLGKKPNAAGTACVAYTCNFPKTFDGKGGCKFYNTCRQEFENNPKFKNYSFIWGKHQGFIRFEHKPEFGSAIDWNVSYRSSSGDLITAGSPGNCRLECNDPSQAYGWNHNDYEVFEETTTGDSSQRTTGFCNEIDLEYAIFDCYVDSPIIACVERY